MRILPWPSAHSMRIFVMLNVQCYDTTQFNFKKYSQQTKQKYENHHQTRTCVNPTASNTLSGPRTVRRQSLAPQPLPQYHIKPWRDCRHCRQCLTAGHTHPPLNPKFIFLIKVTIFIFFLSANLTYYYLYCL